MPGVCRLTDMCTGHGSWPPRPNVLASPNVRANGLGVHRQGDIWLVHCFLLACHPGVLSMGSVTVRANGMGVGRCGDPISCGSTVMLCSSDVWLVDNIKI